jgi:hypothetical protein
MCSTPVLQLPYAACNMCVQSYVVDCNRMCLLQEYAGIDAERLERMEARLKADVLAEAGGCTPRGVH